jgi:16S rRNA (uracil1498-N3)-methyltransferase
VSGHRFFVQPNVFDPVETIFPVEISRQMNNVLRLKSGQMVTILDNRGKCRPVELVDIDPKQVTGRAGEIEPAGGEPSVELILGIALTQREKFEWILQKGCELGVREFHPLITSRTLVQETRGWDEKMTRWQKILQEAAEQCGRGLIPAITAPQKIENYLHQMGSLRGYILHEKVQQTGLAASLMDHLAKGERRFTLLVGPEGGFSPEEVTSAEQSGLLPVSLGKRILRMETAVLAACAVCMAVAGELGDFGSSDKNL